MTSPAEKKRQKKLDKALLEEAKSPFRTLPYHCIELLNWGADPNVKDVFGNSALIWAVRHGKTSMAEALVKAGANTDHANAFGTTAGKLAETQIDPALIALLNPATIAYKKRLNAAGTTAAKVQDPDLYLTPPKKPKL